MTSEQKHPLQKKKSIVLIGFMGVGKTTIGSLLAQNLDRPFIDTDEEIEKEQGMTINDIFAEHGEKVFREMEKQTIRMYGEQPLNILSLGGGAFLQPEVREICLNHCFVVHLDMSWEQWQERLDLLTDTRPLLRGKDLKDIEKLFHERKAVYAKSHITINVDCKTPEEATDEIIAAFTH